MYVLKYSSTRVRRIPWYSYTSSPCNIDTVLFAHKQPRASSRRAPRAREPSEFGSASDTRVPLSRGHSGSPRVRLLFHKIGALEARTGGLHDAHGCAVDVMASDATSDARGKHGGARPPRSSRRRSDKAKQRQLSAFGFRLFCAGNVGVPVVPRAVPANLDGGAEQRAIDVERRHGIVAVPPWRNALWLQQQQQRGGAPIGDPAAGAAGGQTAAAGASGNGDTAVSQAASNAGDGVGASAGGGNDDPKTGTTTWKCPVCRAKWTTHQRTSPRRRC